MEIPAIHSSHADRLSACRQEIEDVVHQIIFSKQKAEFSPAEIAMAIADIADDYILKLSKRQAATH